MKKHVSLYLISLSVLLVMGSFAFADEAPNSDAPNPNDIILGIPALGGNGCPQGTTSAALSPDSKSLSILFDQFQVEAGRTTGKILDRKKCDIAIPIHIPQGFSVSVMQIDYRGFNSIPTGGHSEFSVDYFFAGEKGAAFAKTFYGPLNENFLFTNEVVGRSLVWSACGADTNLRINASMLVAAPTLLDQASATVDSTDVKAALVYSLRWKRCGNETTNPSTPNGPIPPFTSPPLPSVPGPLPPPTAGPIAPPSFPGTPPFIGSPSPTMPLPGSSNYYNGNCRIDFDPYRRDFMVHSVLNNLVGRAPNYELALSLARQADNDGRCLDQTPGVPGFGAGPRPGFPGGMPGPSRTGGRIGNRPVPIPPPFSSDPRSFRPVSCQISSPYGVFSGTGVDVMEATARARSSCLLTVNNARVCNSLPVSCF